MAHQIMAAHGKQARLSISADRGESSVVIERNELEMITKLCSEGTAHTDTLIQHLSRFYGLISRDVYNSSFQSPVGG